MKLIDRFNHRDVHLVISDYPEKVSGEEKNYGIAWYTKETIEPIAEKYGQRFVVLAEKGKDNKARLYARGKILVLRVFDQKQTSLFPRILKWLLAFSNIKKVYVHSEFCTNGGVKNFILLIPFLLLIKLFGKKITYFAHNVVTEIDSIAPHLGIERNTINLALFNLGLRQYYRFLGIIVDRIVVMDEVLQKRIEQFVDGRKVVFVPIWVENKTSRFSKEEARKKLHIGRNDFVLLYFGFITWYKGADWLIDQVQGKKIRLILAGGEAYSLKDKAYYQRYYQEQVGKVKKCNNIKITGFVKEKDIEKYFSAVDLAVFPYRGLIGSSGSVTYTLSFRKPFILSRKMSEIFGNGDFSSALKEAQLKKEEITFGFNKRSFGNFLIRAQNKRFYKKLQSFSKKLSELRSIDRILPSYHERIYTDKEYLPSGSVSKKIAPYVSVRSVIGHR